MRHAVLILSQLAVASAAILARVGLSAGLPVLPMTAWRMTVASCVLLPFLQIPVGARRRVGHLSPQVIVRLIAAGCALGGHFWAWFASLERVPVARSTLLVSTTPIWAVLGVWALTRRAPLPRFWMGLVLALMGGWLLTGGATHSIGFRPMAGGSPLVGDALATLGAVLIAIYFLATADLQRSLGTWRVVAWTYTSAAAALWLAAALTGSGGVVWPPSSRAWVAVVSLALVPQLMGHTMLNWSLRHFTAATVATTTLLEPVFAGVIAWWLFGERLGAMQLAGGVVLLIGVGTVLMNRASGAQRA